MKNRELEALQEEISRAEARLAELDDERVQIARRISELKAQLSSLGRIDDTSHARLTEPSETAPSTSAEKIALFLNLFCGRADVYPKHWMNAKKGTKGCSPACNNEWVNGVCDKRNVRCGECPNQAFIPMTEKTI